MVLCPVWVEGGQREVEEVDASSAARVLRGFSTQPVAECRVQPFPLLSWRPCLSLSNTCHPRLTIPEGRTPRGCFRSRRVLTSCLAKFDQIWPISHSTGVAFPTPSPRDHSATSTDINQGTEWRTVVPQAVFTLPACLHRGLRRCTLTSA